MKMMMRMMMKMSLWLLLIGLAATFTAAARPGSCVGRCGEVFTRGQQCTCDSGCLLHNECCQDFQTVCTNAQSCQGRCGETFRRGQLCDCDPQCVQFNTCCHDYPRQCDASVPVSHTRTFQTLRAAAAGKRKLNKSKKRSSESEEQYIVKTTCPEYPGGQCPGTFGLLNPMPASSSGPAPPAVPTNQLPHGVSNVPAGLLPVSSAPSHGGAPDSPARSSSLPAYSAPSLGSSGPVSPFDGPGAAGGNANVHLVVSPGGHGVAPSGPSQGFGGPAGSRPSTLQDVAQALGLSEVGAGPEGPGTGLLADVDLCSDSPINGLTALINGTILIFKGEKFWSVDPVSHSVGSPQSITDTLGVPSPIDTVFTRCNCNGNIYIIKGDQYWRFDGNLVMEPGYPKPLTSEFPGLTGGINAALAAPATRSTPENVFFFKNGDIMQTFAFPSGSTPSCGKMPTSSSQKLFARQTEGLLGREINIKVSLNGFPTPVTSALSMPSPQTSGQYEHYIFSGPLFFTIQISGNLPALAKPDPSAVFAPLRLVSPVAMATSAPNMATQNANPPQPAPSPPPANSITVWLRCP